MERLSDTAIAIINDLHTERLDYQSEYLPLIDAANFLAAYEATGLEPCDYAAMRAALEQADRARQDLNDLLHIVGAAGIDHLRGLLRAEQDGRLVVLPCKTGDTIYQIRGKRHAQGVGISPRTVSCAHVWSNGDYSLSHQGMEVCRKKDLGKTWFLTSQEAMEALKGESHETDSF